MLRSLALILSSIGSCLAADWQFSAGAGFGSYHPVTFTSAAGNAQAGIGPRTVLDAAGGRRISDRFAIEAAWTYQDGDFELASGGTKTAFDADAHAVHADSLGYLRRSRMRPYLVGGAGAKFYHGSEPPGSRPLAQFGSFRDGIDTRPLLTFGGGVEWSLSEHWSLRLDLRDYATPFPSAVILAASSVPSHGWLHDFVPVIGVTFR